jgi:predicted Zn-dependent protease
MAWLRFACALVLVAAVACSSTEKLAPPEPDFREADVYLIRFGPIDREVVQRLASYYTKELSLHVEISPPVEMTPEFLDSSRQQLVAQRVLALLVVSREKTTTNPNALLIGITPYDMYTLDRPDWRFAFASRHGRCCSIISTARMDKRNFGDIDTNQAVFERLRKMVSKTIGLQHFGLELREDPRSVLYGGVLSLDDLDQIDDSDLRRQLAHPDQW